MVCFLRCTLTHFQKGGVCMMMEAHNTSKIQNCTFRFNKTFGIQLFGRTVQRPVKIRHHHHRKKKISFSDPELEETEVIQGCLIEGNEGPGIQIVIPNCALIKHNTITNNTNGIEVVSADPRILENIITRNSGEGIYVKSMENMRAAPLIRQNHIRSNGHNGVLCTGNQSQPKIWMNQEISLNKACGVKVMDQAHPRIVSNRIDKNIFQGVLVVENSAAHIEKNEICENIKANIAFGGESSANTVIIKNTISRGRCIFMVEAGSAYIQRNTIEGNYDGIVMITSAPEVSNNDIKNNTYSGIMIMKDSRPKLYSNKIYGNMQLGLYIRDNCRFDRPAAAVIKEEDLGLMSDQIASPPNGKVGDAGGLETPRSEGREQEFMSPIPTNHDADHKEEMPAGTLAQKLKAELARKMITFPIDNPISLIIERPISNGKMIMEMNPSLEPHMCRIPYTCGEIHCIHKPPAEEA